MHIILQLGSTNDAEGTLDADGFARAARVSELYAAEAAAGAAADSVFVLVWEVVILIERRVRDSTRRRGRTGSIVRAR